MPLVAGPYSYQPPEDGLPPKEVRILGLRAEPWPDDSHRVRVHLDLTPFLERPDIEVVLSEPDDVEIGSISIIESIDAKMTFTMHIRGESLKDTYILKASVAYTDIGTVDQKSISFAASLQID